MSTRAPGRLDGWLTALGLACLLLIPVALLATAHDWPGVYGQDAYWYHAFAVGELRSSLLELRAPAPFTWPPGFPLLTAFTSLLTGPTTAAGQLVSLVAGALVPVLTWALARELRPWTGHPPWWVALLAGVMVAWTPHLWQSSAVVMSDTTGLASMTLGAYALVRWANGASLCWAVLAAAAVAFAIDTRQVYALAGLPLAVAGLVVGIRRARDPDGPGLALTLGLPLLAGMAVLGPVVGPMVRAWLAGELVPFSIQLVSHTWDLGNLFRTEIASRDGLGRWTLPMALFYLTEPGRAYHLGPFFASLAIVGLVAVLRRPSVVAVAVLLGWPAIVLGFLGGDVVQNTRYALAVLPPLAILAAGAVAVAQRWADRHGRWRRIPVRVLPAVAVAGVLAIMLTGAVRFTTGFIDRFQADRAAISRLAAQVPADDRLIAFQSTLALRHLGRDALELYELTPEAALALAADRGTLWLLLPRDGLASQWAAEPPGRAVAALRDGAGIRLVDRSGAWELWQEAN